MNEEIFSETMRVVEVKTAGKERLDRWLAEKFPEHSRSRWKQFITTGRVRVDGRIANPKEILSTGRRVEVAEQVFAGVTADVDPPRPEKLPLDVLFEDEHLLVINKRPGMVVHPGNGVKSGTVVNAALHHCGWLPDVAGTDRPWVVHRIDKETSGILILAKSRESGEGLLRQFRERQLSKVYLAVAQGIPANSEGSCVGKIGRHPVRRTRMAIVDEGRTATSHWRILGASPEEQWSVWEVRIETGRTHQIRVHLSGEGHPIVGDTTYGFRKKQSGGATRNASRVLLHAFRLSLSHPVKGVEMRWEAPIPEDFRPFWSQVEQDRAAGC